MLDVKDEEEELSNEELVERASLISLFWNLSTKEESLMLQKSISKWIREGDSNTRYC